MFHHVANLLSHLCQFPIGPGRARQMVEHPKSKSTQPRFTRRCPARPVSDFYLMISGHPKSILSRVCTEYLSSLVDVLLDLVAGEELVVGVGEGDAQVAVGVLWGRIQQKQFRLKFCFFRYFLK